MESAADWTMPEPSTGPCEEMPPVPVSGEVVEMPLLDNNENKPAAAVTWSRLCLTFVLQPVCLNNKYENTPQEFNFKFPVAQDASRLSRSSSCLSSSPSPRGVIEFVPSCRCFDIIDLDLGCLRLLNMFPVEASLARSILLPNWRIRNENFFSCRSFNNTCRSCPAFKI